MGTDSTRTGPAGRPAREQKPQVNGPLAAVSAGSPGGLTRSQRLGLRVAGAGLLIATAAIHLDLYLTGYRSIPTIGWLFLLQVIAGFVLANAAPSAPPATGLPRVRGLR